MKEEKVCIKLLNDKAILPTYGSVDAAGADLYANIESTETILPHETKLIKTGVAMAIPKGLVGLLFARSGLASKRGLAPANKVGVVDADYRGEILVALHNHSDVEQSIEPNERIAQMAFIPYVKGNFEVVDDLEETVRGEGGFGSTGTK
jgi:dUTP pyrophosphatase